MDKQNILTSVFRRLRPERHLLLTAFFIVLLGFFPVFSKHGGSGLTRYVPGPNGTEATYALPLAGGDYSIDFSAHDPANYDRLFPNQITPPSMRNAGADPLNGADHCVLPCAPSDNLTRESLAPEDLALGQIVAFDFHITVDAPPQCNATDGDCITIVAEWNTKTTSGGDFGYDPDYMVFAAFIDPSDPAHSESGSIDAYVSSVSSMLVDNGTNNERIQGTFEICGLEPADEVVAMEVWVVLKPDIPASATGNVQSKLVTSYTSGTSDDPINCDPEADETITSSAQTVPLLKVKEFFTSDVDVEITKSDNLDPVPFGGQFTYTLTVTNHGPAVANDVIVTDQLDPHTSFISVHITDSEGYVATSSDCSEVGGVLTCDLQFLNPDEIVTIEVTVQVLNTAPTGGGGGDECNGDPHDLVNNATVTSISDDTDETNNTDCEPTDVNPPCPTCDITASSTTLNCPGTLVNYMVDLSSACTGASYVWKVDGVVMGSNSFSFSFTPSDCGIYQITSEVTCEECPDNDGDGSPDPVVCDETLEVTSPQVDVSCPGNQTISGCDDITGEFASWLSGFTLDNAGCGTTASFDKPQVAPLCTGGSITLTYSADDGCTSDACTAAFTVNAAPAVDVSCPGDKAISGCDDIAAEFDAWLLGFTLDNAGCGTTASFDKPQVAPLCTGGSITLTYSADDGCTSDACTAAFTVNAAPAVDVSCPGDKAISGCDNIAAEFDAWLLGFTLDNAGCGTTASFDKPQVAPLCTGGSITLTYSADDGCTSDACTAAFTVNAAPAVDVSCPGDKAISGCDNITAEFDAWLLGFTLDNAGCGTTASFDKPQVAPLCTGGSITLTYSADDGCTSDACTAAFTVNAAPAVDVSCPGDKAVSGCDNITAEFDAWLLGFTLDNAGCGTTASFDKPQVAPLCTGGSITLTYSADDGCTSDACTAAFTVNAAPAVDVSCPGDKAVSGCDNITAEFDAWLLGFTLDNAGCGTTASFDKPQVAPLCTGGSITLTYSADDGCTSDDCTATFTVNAAPAVDVSCPGDKAVSGCDNITAEFDAWLLGFTLDNAGCGTTASFDKPQVAPLCTGGSITLTYSADDGCTSDACTAAFTVNAAPAVDVSCPGDKAVSGCDNITAEFDAWLLGFTLDNAGCGTTASFDKPQVAPLCTGGSITLTYSADDGCTSDDCTATFTVNAAPAVDVSCPGDKAVSGCDDIAAEFDAWLLGFTLDNAGCGTTASFDKPQVAPLCTGGSITLTYSADDGCTSDACTAAFTVNAAPAVDVSCPGDKAISGCDDIAAEFDAWLLGFTLDNAGCGTTASFDKPQVAPLCTGGSITLTYSADDGCTSDACTAAFTVNAAPAVDVSCPGDKAISGCDDIAAEFDAWLLGFTLDNAGCGTTASFDKPQVAPLCTGGSITLTYSADDGCTSDACTAAFTVNAAPAVDVSCPGDKAISGCDDIAAEFDAWLLGFTLDNAGCGTTASFDKPQVAPLCTGGSITLTYSADDGCTSDACTAAFTVNAAPAVDVSCPGDKAISGCDDIAAEFDAWLLGFTLDNAGCGTTASFDKPQVAPLCTGGSITLTYSADDGCTSDDCTATFTVNAAPAVDVSCPGDKAVSGCDNITAEFDAWLLGFILDNAGCGTTASFDKPQVAPLCTGGSITLTYSADDGCTSDDCTATFTVNAAPAVDVSCPGDKAISGCDDIAAEFDAWLLGFTLDNAGCGTTASFDKPQVAPLCTGGSITLTYSADDGCTSDACTAAFTVNAAPAVDVSCPGDKAISGCDDIAAEFDAWLLGFTLDNAGCGTTASFDKPQVAPLCTGGSITLTYSADDGCTSDACTAAFTVNAAPAVDVSCPGDKAISGCDDIAAEFDAWLLGFTLDNAGCGTTASFDKPQVAPLCTGGSITLTYSADDGCTSDACTAAFTVNAAPAVDVSCPGDKAVSGCDNITAEFDAWLLGFTLDNAGCGTTASFDKPQVAPLCTGGSITLTYSADDGCTSDACTAAFTVNAAPAVDVSCPGDKAISGCDDIAAEFDAWLLGFTLDNAGCGTTASFDKPQVAPLCTGGSITLTYSADDGCTSDACTAAFTVNAAPAVDVSCPGDKAVSGCDNIAVEFKAWMMSFTLTNAGCNATASFDKAAVEPPCIGGSITLTYSADDGCTSDACTATFTVTPAPAVTVSCPGDVNTSVCTYPDQAALTTAYESWIAGFMVDGMGCGATGGFVVAPPAAVDYCQGADITVTWQASDGCTSDECTASFFVAGDNQPPTCPPALSNNALNCPEEIPCLSDVMLDIQEGATDNCPGEVTAEMILDSGFLPCSEGSFGRTYEIRLTDQCGLTTDCTISYSGFCNGGGACTLTQGGWGNEGGKYPWNNEEGKAPTLDIITALLNDPDYGDGELVIGDVEEGNSLTITHPDCILALLPGNGSPAPLPGPGTVLNGDNLGGDALAEEVNCRPYTNRYHHNRTGRLRNNLATNVIALQLNIWYGQAVNGASLGDILLDGPCFSIEQELPASVITIQDLLDYANDFLSGQVEDTQGLAGTITDAITSVNEYWDECSAPTTDEDPCIPTEGRAIAGDAGTDIGINSQDVSLDKNRLSVRPNPATDEVELAFYSNQEEPALIRIVNLNGKVVRTAPYDAAEGMNYKRIAVNNLSAGLYWITVQKGERVLVQKLVVMKL